MQILQLITFAVAVATASPQVSPPDSIEVVRDVVYAAVPQDPDEPPVQLLLDAAFPKETDGQPLPVVVYIHGGGWVMGNKSDGLPMAIAMAEGGYLGVTVQYRLAGQATYPAAVHDCKAAIRFLRANAEALGIDPDRIGVWGHSAGGHLAALLGTSHGVPELDGRLGPQQVSTEVACAVSVSGPADLNHFDGRRGQQVLQQWFGLPASKERTQRQRMASPVTHVDPEDPPFLIVHGLRDNIVPPEQGRLLHERIEQSGGQTQFVPVDGAGHMIADPHIYAQIGEFFDEHLGGSVSDTMSQTMARYQRARRQRN
jgi:acetyl esterase/lipase